MNRARADGLVARERLAQSGWVPRSEVFRHLPPPDAAMWLAEGAADEDPDAALPLERSGWTLQPSGASLHARVSARWLDAADGAQRAELLAGLPPLPAAADSDAGAAPFAWAHRALCRQGLRVQVSRSPMRAADDAFVWLALNHQPRLAVEAPLAVVDIDPGVRAVLLETHEAPAAGHEARVQNLQLHLNLGAGATLVHLRLIAPGADDCRAHHVHTQLAAGAHYRQMLVASGCRYHLQRQVLALDGAGASATLGVLALANAAALDVQLRAHHTAAQTHSRIAALALAQGRAHAVLNAHSHIARGCNEAQAHQHLDAVPLFGQPHVVLRPHLQIEHDQVQATHGATWGALPQDALQYARQRGLAPHQARALIIDGLAQRLLTRTLADAEIEAALDASRRVAEALTAALPAAPHSEEQPHA